jgi:uncharacterized OsmC-like protein
MEAIREAVEQATHHLAAHPEAASGPDAAATAVLEDGLRCRVESPAGAVVTDMTKAVGGGESAPSPGWMMRAALAACDATIIAIEAAREGVGLEHLRVSVESDSDFRGMLGLGDDVRPGPLNVRIRIELSAPEASEEQLRAIVARAEARSPVGDAIAHAVPVRTEVEVG